jgi:hypothetical protein
MREGLEEGETSLGNTICWPFRPPVGFFIKPVYGL